MRIEHWHRRTALMLASQLSDGKGDALAVLECVRALVATFLQSDTPEPAKAKVVTLVRDCQDLSA
jgi:hypothetical protein